MSLLFRPNKPCLPRLPRSRPQIRQQRHHSSNPDPNLKNTSTRNNTTRPPGTTASSGGVPPSAPTRTLRGLIQAGPLGRLARAFSRTQERRPYATQLGSSFVVYLCGDLSAQIYFPSSPDAEYDPWRTARHLACGLGSSIPSYEWLVLGPFPRETKDKRDDVKLTGTRFMYLHYNFNFASRPLSIFTKVCIHQCFFAPVFNIYFFSVQSILSGASLSDTWERLKVAVPSSLLTSVKVWPAVQTISFTFVPPQFRPVFSGSIAVAWQSYLSWLNQKAAREVEAREKESSQTMTATA